MVSAVNSSDSVILSDVRKTFVAQVSALIRRCCLSGRTKNGNEHTHVRNPQEGTKTLPGVIQGVRLKLCVCVCVCVRVRVCVVCV